MIYLILLAVGLYFILSGLGTLLSVFLSLLAVPFSLLNDLTNRGKTSKSPAQRAREASAETERRLNEYYEKKYFSDDAPPDLDENGIPYL